MEIRTTYHRSRRQLEPRLAGDGAGTKIVGYAAVFYDGTPGTEYELWPGVRERIMPGAFDRAIVEDDVRALFNHDPNMVLGRTSSGTCILTVDRVGLKYSIDAPDTGCGIDTRKLIARRDITGSSFAFEIEEEKWIWEADGSEIRELWVCGLFDVGPVTFPAYEATTAGVRGTGGKPDTSPLPDRSQRLRTDAEAEAVEVDYRWSQISSRM